MSQTSSFPKFAYVQPEEQKDRLPRRYPLVIVGAGPVGLVAAIDARLHGIPVVLLDRGDTVSPGSRAVCHAKRTLEILDRLGVGERVAARGVSWHIGRTFCGDDEVFRFDLLPEADQKRPGMVNLQQYYLEQFLIERCIELGVDLRWKNRLVSLQRLSDQVRLTIETPDGTYGIEADWLIAADGAASTVRTQMKLDFEGQAYHDRFLIADVVMQADFPPERWFWFDPPFYPGRSVLLHHQADNVWRVDFQLAPDADPAHEVLPENLVPRIAALLGDGRPFEVADVSVYSYRCAALREFRHGRVLFAGDAAHQLSPFGARGSNSGIQDADNLIWKLKLVLDGLAPETLLDSYSLERGAAAQENLSNARRAAEFIAPKSEPSRVFRDAALKLAKRHPFARALVNSGRLSVPAILEASPLNTPDAESFGGKLVPGAPLEDAPVACNGQKGWLLDHLGGRGFQLIYFTDVAESLASRADDLRALACDPVPVATVVISEKAGALPGLTVLHDLQHLAARRFDAREGSVFLLRPDQHVAGRWRRFDAQQIRAAVARASGNA